jgi:hypothetical protein
MESVPDWKGLHSARFTGGRVHLRPQDQLTLPEKEEEAYIAPSRKHFELGATKEEQHRPSIRTSSLTYTTTHEEIPHRHRKMFEFVPTSKRARPERVHIRAQESRHQEDGRPQGLHCEGRVTRNSSKEYRVEHQLQMKGRVDDPLLQRNRVPVASLGDKPYKYPEQAPLFYQPGGLVPGSTMRPRKPRQFQELPSAASTATGKLTWKERLRLEEQQLQDKDVD